MLNLVTVTKDSRIFLKFSAIFLGVAFIIYMFVQGGILVQNIFFPKPAPPPVQAFGRLPHISFPSAGTPGIEFRINTIDGNLPVLPDRLNVYKLRLPEPNLLALQAAKRALSGVGFSDNQTKLSDTLYQWSQTKTGAIMQYDIVTQNFTITSNYLTNPLLSTTRSMPPIDSIQANTYNFVQSINSKTTDINKDKTKVELLEMQNGSLVPSENATRAKYARIILKQNDIDSIPVIYDTPNDSILSFVVAFPDSDFQILEGQFFYHQPDLENKSDYPIKTAETAFNDLTKGNAYMINPQNLTSVDITNVELRYYLTKNSSEYVLPVFVFTGINFAAYVEAIPSTSLEN